MPFSVALPWETPITEPHGQHLGVVLGVRAEPKAEPTEGVQHHREAYGTHAASMGHDPYAGHGPHGGHPVDHRSGPGTGTAAAAGVAGPAVGVVGAMVAAEVVGEIGDFFEGDESEDD